MKTTCLLMLSLLLIALTVRAEAAPDPVLDVDGKMLRLGVDYYILSVIRGAGGGGLTLASVGNQTCPLAVVQEKLDLLKGLPVTFTPVNPKKGVIRVSTDHNIKFSAATTCEESTVWKLDAHDESSGKFFVTTGGVEGNPGSETLRNWFKIEKLHEDYKLLYCPTVCDNCKPVCGDLGIFTQDGVRRLALSDQPFRVVFQKA